MVMVDGKINNDIEMHLRCWPFWWPWQCTRATQMASPNAACPELPRKPLDAGIGWLLAPYCPSGCQGNRQTYNNQQLHLKRWPNWWPWQCAGTVLRTSPDGGGLGLCKMLLNTTIRQVLWLIESNETKKRPFFFEFFHCRPTEKGLEVTSRSLITIGVWHINPTRRS